MTVVGDANAAWEKASPSILSSGSVAGLPTEAKVVYAGFIFNMLAVVVGGGAALAIVVRYAGTMVGCRCGLRQRVKFEDLLKQFDESRLEDTESVLGVDLERHPLMLDVRKDEEVVPLVTESDVSVSDMISHETVDSRGQLKRIKISKELASAVDIMKHKMLKRATMKNRDIRARVETLHDSQITSKAGSKRGSLLQESADSLSAGGTWHRKSLGKIGTKVEDERRVETPPEFIDSQMDINYDDMELGKSIDTADIAHDPNQGYNVNNSLDALEEKSSPAKLNLADLKRHHAEYLGDKSMTPYGSVDGKRLAQTHRSNFSAVRRSADRSIQGSVPLEYRERTNDLSAYDIEKFKPYLQ